MTSLTRGGGDGALLDSISRGVAHFNVNLSGSDWRMTASPLKRYDHFEVETEFAEPVIAGVGQADQMRLSGRVNKWVRLARMPNERLDDYRLRLQEQDSMMRIYRSHLLLGKSHDTSGSRVVAIATKVPRIGYGWMPVLPSNRHTSMSFEHAKACATWLNSTLGRLALRKVWGRKLSYPQFNPVAFNAVPFPNLYDSRLVEVLVRCFERTDSDVIPRFREGRTEVREEWDNAVSEALEIDRVLIGRCADMLARDPAVCKDAFFESI